MRRGRNTGVFALNLGLSDPQPAVSRCPEQQGNTCTMNKPLQLRALCLSEGLELGSRTYPTLGVVTLGTLLPTIPRGSRWDPLPQAKFSCELAALRYQNQRAKEVSKEKLKRLKGVWMKRMSLLARGPLEKAMPRMPPAQGTSRNASISAARGFPGTSRTCAMLGT